MKGSAHSGVSTAQSLSFMWMIDFPMMFHSQFIGVKLSTVTAVFLKVCAQLCIVTVCVCVCVWAVSKDVKLVSSHIILQGATGEVYSQWPTKTLYTSCVNVPALVLTVDLRFC